MLQKNIFDFDTNFDANVVNKFFCFHYKSQSSIASLIVTVKEIWGSKILHIKTSLKSWSFPPTGQNFGLNTPLRCTLYRYTSFQFLFAKLAIDNDEKIIYSLSIWSYVLWVFLNILYFWLFLWVRVFTLGKVFLFQWNRRSVQILGNIWRPFNLFMSTNFFEKNPILVFLFLFYRILWNKHEKDNK